MRHWRRIVRPSDTTRARLVEVCTRPGMATDMRCTPSGQPITARISLPATSGSMMPAGMSHAAAPAEIESSMPANSTARVFS